MDLEQGETDQTEVRDITVQPDDAEVNLWLRNRRRPTLEVVGFHVDIDKHYYSVPRRFARAGVEVRLSGRSEILAKASVSPRTCVRGGNGKHTAM